MTRPEYEKFCNALELDIKRKCGLLKNGISLLLGVRGGREAESKR